MQLRGDFTGNPAIVRNQGPEEKGPEDGVYADRLGSERREKHGHQGPCDRAPAHRMVLAITGQALGQGPHDDEHEDNERERQQGHEQRVFNSRLSHADDEREQTPRREVVDGRATERHHAELGFVDTAVLEDAGEHGKSRDRHGHAHEQSKTRERHAFMRQQRIEQEAHRYTERERHNDAGV